MQKVKLFSGLIILLVMGVSFFSPKKEKINWMSFKEMQEAYGKNPKPILVDVYTDWCGWCKVMDKNTYSNSKVADYINEHYYAVRYNAEDKNPVEFGNKKYSYNPAYKANDLAMYLLFGQLSFPSTVLISSIGAQPAPIPGYMKPAELEAPLRYFGDSAFATQNFPEFMKSFKASWK
jgi:thioredoxin-related protein